MSEIFSPKALLRARARAKLTQKELGKKSGISPHQIHRYEKGRTTPREVTILAIADALALNPDSLFIETTEN